MFGAPDILRLDEKPQSMSRRATHKICGRCFLANANYPWWSSFSIIAYSAAMKQRLMFSLKFCTAMELSAEVVEVIRYHRTRIPARPPRIRWQDSASMNRFLPAHHRQRAGCAGHRARQDKASRQPCQRTGQPLCQFIQLANRGDGGASRSRTDLHGFAIRCITALLSRR